MNENTLVNVNFPQPQYTSPSRTRDVTLVLDHLEEGVHRGVRLPQLYREIKNIIPGEKVVFHIDNAVSSKEQELFKFCKDQLKKKKFEAIVARAAELLANHPNSLWAHFFYGAACKNIKGKEKFVVPALTAAVSINPNFLSGWRALHNHLLALGGLFSQEVHDQVCLVVEVLLKLEPNYENWGALVGHVWDYIMSNDFEHNRVLSILVPYLSCSCPLRQTLVANVFVNFIKVKKLLTKEFSDHVLVALQVLITQEESEMYRLGLLHTAINYFNLTNDLRQICHLLNYIHINNALQWNLATAKELAYNLIYELFLALGEEALEAILILREACGPEILTNSRYLVCDLIFKLTDSYSSLLETRNSKLGQFQTWGRLLYLKVLLQLKLYQEAYEQVLVDLNFGVGNPTMEKSYMEMLIEIFSHAMDPSLQRFSIQLGFKYLKLYGLDVKVLHCLCLACISLNDVMTAREIMKKLLSMGALDDVVYLQSLVEEDNDVKLDYLKSLQNVPEANLLSAIVYRDMGKPKRVLKSMLEASFHFHGGITPFEWLGIYYYERCVHVKATKYFLEAFSNHLVSCITVNYIISIYWENGDVEKTRAFIDTLCSRSALTTDVACNANLKAGLNFLTKAQETLDFHRAVERFRKVMDFSFERKIIEMVADSLGYFGMHGSAADFYLMCHAEHDAVHVYPSILYGAETKMIEGKGFRYLDVARNVAKKAETSPLAMFTYGCAVFDRAIASYSVNNHRHCSFLCQQAVLVLCRSIALFSNVATFWISLGNVMFTASSLHSNSGSMYVPSWLISNGQHHSMVLVQKHECLILALRCYAVAMQLSRTEEIKKLVAFYIGLTFRYAKTFYKEIGDRMLCWGLSYALDSCDSQCWQRYNLCGVILTGLGKYRVASEFFKDSMLLGAREDARDAEFNLGIVYLRLGELNNAHEMFMHRRGNDPNDYLVWRSYMLLHHCLGDNATVLHYLWYLIYSIRHYPSFDQGMEYLKLISNSCCMTDDRLDPLRKQFLLYAIYKSPLFMKLTFAGDCEVPHKINDVTAYNYFFHGTLHALQGHRSTAKENFFEFLKIAAETGSCKQSDIDHSLFWLAMFSESMEESLLHLEASTNKSPEVALAELWASQNTTNGLAANMLEEGHKIYKNSQLSTSHLYPSYISRTLINQLVGISSPISLFQQSICQCDTFNELINNIFVSCKLDESCNIGLTEIPLLNVLNELIVQYKLS